VDKQSLPESVPFEKKRILAAFRDVQNETKNEIHTLVPGGAQSAYDLAETRVLNEEKFRRGVCSRSIWETRIRRDAVTREHVQWLNDMGSEVRTIPTVPVRMIISDRKTAIVQTEPEDFTGGITIYRAPSAVQVFQTLFDTLWAQAAVWGERFSLPEKLNDSDKSMLELLAVGCRYAEVAHRMGIDESTVRRRLKVLMKQLDAATPFEAAYQAVKKGWL